MKTLMLLFVIFAHGLYVNAATAEPKRITMSEGDKRSPVIAFADKAIIFIADIDNQSKICIETIDEMNGKCVAKDLVRMSNLKLSSDQEFLAFSALEKGSFIYVLDLKTNQLIKVAEGASPDWSPDGKWVAFVNKGDVYIAERKGNYSNIKRLTTEGYFNNAHWLREDMVIVGGDFEKNGYSIWTIDIKTKEISELLHGKQGTENIQYVEAIPSYNGKYILVVTSGMNDAVTTIDKVWLAELKQPFDKGLPDKDSLKWVNNCVPIAFQTSFLGDCLDVRWSVDSAKLAYCWAGEMWVYAVNKNKKERITKGKNFDGYPCFSSAGDKVVFASKRIDTNDDGFITWKDRNDIWIIDIK